MTTVKVRDVGTGKTTRLTQTQVQLFVTELRRTADSQSDPTDQPRGIARDCLISVTTGSGTSEYGLYGRTVLRNMKTRRERQFYMGLLILEWLR